jgi:hypothetical protein
LNVFFAEADMGKSSKIAELNAVLEPHTGWNVWPVPAS